MKKNILVKDKKKCYHRYLFCISAVLPVAFLMKMEMVLKIARRTASLAWNLIVTDFVGGEEKDEMKRKGDGLFHVIPRREEFTSEENE